MRQLCWKEFRREVQKTRGRWRSLWFLTLLAVAVLLGLRVTPSLISASAETYFQEQGLFDLEITSPFGFTQEDLAQIRQVPGVVEATPWYRYPALLDLDQGGESPQFPVQVISYTPESDLNLPALTQGSYPLSPTDCLVSPQFLQELGKEIGDTIYLSLSNQWKDLQEEGGEPQAFTLVGVGDHPLYASTYGGTTFADGGSAGFVLLSDQLFPWEAVSEIYLSVEEGQESQVNQELTALGEAIGTAWGMEKVEETILQLDQGLAALNLEEAALDALFSQEDLLLEQARLALSQGWQEYQERLDHLDSGELDSEAVALEEQALETLYQQLQQAEQQHFQQLLYYQSWVEEKDTGLEGRRMELEQNRRDIILLVQERWEVTGKEGNLGYHSYRQDVARMEKLAVLFPALFFAVAMLVCVTTLLRMVESQRVAQGVYTSLGCPGWLLVLRYALYGATAMVPGALCGAFLGAWPLPYALELVWLQVYHTGDLAWSLDSQLILLTLLLVFLLSTVPVSLGCLRHLVEDPAKLMRPKPPKQGRRVFLEKIDFLWYELNFYQKITMRNLLRYKKRFWASVGGIAGCTALIVVSLALVQSLHFGTELQYGQIYRYTGELSLVEGVTPLEKMEVTQYLDQEALSYLLLATEELQAVGEQDSWQATLVLVEDPAALLSFVQMQKNWYTPFNMPRNGAVISQKLADLLDLTLGDSLVLEGSETLEVVVAGVTEHYLDHRIYMTKGYYQDLAETPLTDSLVLLKYQSALLADPGYEQSLSEGLMELAGVLDFVPLSIQQQFYTNSNRMIQSMAWIMQYFAWFLAFVVLYILGNGNLSQRHRELSVLKVLGYYDNQISDYVFRENFFLTFYGMLFGIYLGQKIHYWLIPRIELEDFLLYRGLRLDSYLYGAGLTVFFSILVNFVAYLRVKKLDMVAGLKSTE